MVTFYRDVIGLEIMAGRYPPHIVFFRIAEGFGGHTAVLALFEENGSAAGAGSSLHHLALTLPFAQQDAVIDWYEKIGQPYQVETFGWVGWRGIFTSDPDGNRVELVAYHRSLLA